MLNNKISTVMERINTHSNEDAFIVFKNICFEFDIEKFALAVFSGQKNIVESFFINDTYPEEWMHRYKEKQYHLYDPVFSSLKKVAIPFEWNAQSFRNILPIQQILLDESQDFGIKSGVTIPLFPHPTFHGFLTVLNQQYLHPEVLFTLSLIANVCANKIMSMLENQALDCLTEREKEILLHKSQGLPIKAISHKLGIAPVTVTFHLKNIRNKLGTHSTEQSLFKFASACHSVKNL